MGILKTGFGILVSVIIIFLMGCSPFKNEAPPMLKTSSIPSNAFVNVIKVIDGTTITVDLNGTEQTIRYAMIDSPEQHDKSNVAHAKKYNETLINQSDGKVKLILDAAVKSQVKNPEVFIAYVVLADGKIANEEMIKSGLARVSDKIVTQFKKEGKDITDVLKSQLIKVESNAKKQMIGIWKTAK